MTTCTRCDGTGFLNIDQVDDYILKLFDASRNTGMILDWMKDNPTPTNDVQVCDCCGDGSDWYGTPGEHYNQADPRGNYGPYAYNGGLCECN